MTVLTWIAVLAAAWFVASVVAALGMGRYLRRRAGSAGETRRPLGALPLSLWLAELPRVATLSGLRPAVPGDTASGNTAVSTPRPASPPRAEPAAR